MLVVLGGLAELGTSLFSILAFNKANEYGMNAGLAGVLFPLSSTFVALITYFMYQEKLNKVQGVGLIIVIAGATLIAAFPAEKDDVSEEDDSVAKTALPKEICIVLAFGLLATLCLTCELLLARVLSKRGVDGKYIGLNFLVVEGTIGTVCLVISSATGDGIFETG